MGRSKALLPFGHEVLLQRVVGLLKVECDPIVVVAAVEQVLPDLPEGVSIVRDDVADQGPLPALTRGLAALPEISEFAYATATDVPFLQPAWIRLLVDRIADSDVALPEAEGRFHPLAALYRPATVLPIADRFTRERRLKLLSLKEAIRTRIVSEAELRTVDPDLRTLRNLNAPTSTSKRSMTGPASRMRLLETRRAPISRDAKIVIGRWEHRMRRRPSPFVIHRRPR